MAYATTCSTCEAEIVGQGEYDPRATCEPCGGKCKRADGKVSEDMLEFEGGTVLVSVFEDRPESGDRLITLEAHGDIRLEGEEPGAYFVVADDEARNLPAQGS